MLAGLFDELAKRSLMSPLAGMKHICKASYMIMYCEILTLFSSVSKSLIIHDNI